MSGTSDKSPIYRLYGVVVHLDIMNAAFSGHYVCYVKNIQNKWFKIDDSMVCFFLGQFAFLACLTTKIVISLTKTEIYPFNIGSSYSCTISRELVAL